MSLYPKNMEPCSIDFAKSEKTHSNQGVDSLWNEQEHSCPATLFHTKTDFNLHQQRGHFDDFAMESQVIVRIVIVGPSPGGLRCSCVSGESCIFLCFRGVLCILETFCKRVPEQPGQQQDPAQPTPANENIWIFEEKRWWSDPTSAKHNAAIDQDMCEATTN